MKKHIVQETGSIRIDKYVSEIEESITRVAVQRMLETGKILVNGRQVKASYKLVANDEITIEKEIVEEVEMKPEDIPLDVIYEDSDILVINKEKGMVVHPR